MQDIADPAYGIQPVATDVCGPADTTKRIIDDLESTYIPTRFYKTIPYVYTDVAVWGPQYNYTPYDIFCLKKNLEPIFSSLDLTFDLKSFMGTIPNGKNKKYMILSIVPRKGNDVLQMNLATKNKLTEEVDFVCSVLYRKALLFDPEAKTKFPKTWLLNVFPHIRVDQKLKYIGGKLYFEADPRSQYTDDYDDLYRDLLSDLAELYLQGTVSCSEKFAEKWNLIKKEKLYQPNWTDTRITNDPSMFLLNLMHNKDVVVEILPDTLYRHYLVKRSEAKLVFNPENNTVLVSAKSIKDIDLIIETMDDFKSWNIKYTIFTVGINNIQKYQKYCEYIKSIYTNSDCVYYNISNNLYRYMMSIVVYEIDPEMQNKLQRLLM